MPRLREMCLDFVVIRGGKERRAVSHSGGLEVPYGIGGVLAPCKLI